MARRRPRPLVVDSLFALVLAVVSLALVETGTGVDEGPVERIDYSLNLPPSDVRPGSAWNAEIVVFRNGSPGAVSGRALPLLTVQSARTGRWTTKAAKPTDVPGFYRARVRFRDAGEHTYSVHFGDGLRAMAVGEPMSPVGEGVVPVPQPAPEVPRESPSLPIGLVVLTLLATLPIALRRRFPLSVLAVTLAAALTAHLAHENFLFAGPLVALYTVAAHVGRPRSLLAAAAAAVVLPPPLVIGDTGMGVWELLSVLMAAVGAWLLGDNLRTRRERAARLEAEREANVRRAAAEEQARVGRELHDIIGHSVSVMTIQAAAAGDAFELRPAEVREALRAIESTGRETLAELRRLLGGMRPDDDGTFAPTPGLENLEALVERVRGAGLAVELTSDRPRDPLPPSLDLSAYRIVQEALTNTLKHAGATTARVDVRRSNGALEIEVVDDGRAATAGPPGQGIIGMRERAAMFGGDLTAGPAPGGGFAVRARIPLEERVP